MQKTRDFRWFVILGFVPLAILIGYAAAEALGLLIHSYFVSLHVLGQWVDAAFHITRNSGG